MAQTDVWYDATTTNDMEPHITIGDEESVHLEDWKGPMFNSKAQLIDLLR